MNTVTVHQSPKALSPWERQLALKRLSEKSLSRTSQDTASNPFVRRSLDPDPGSGEERKSTNGLDAVLSEHRRTMGHLREGSWMSPKRWWTDYQKVRKAVFRVLEGKPEERKAWMRENMWGSEEWRARDSERILKRNKRRRQKPRMGAGESLQSFERREGVWEARRAKDAARKREERARKATVTP